MARSYRRTLTYGQRVSTGLNGPGLEKHRAEELVMRKTGRGIQISFQPRYKIQYLCFKENLTEKDSWQRRLSVARQDGTFHGQ